MPKATPDFFKTPESKTPTIDYGAWEKRKRWEFSNNGEHIPNDALNKTIRTLVQLKNGLLASGSYDILEAPDPKSRYGYRSIHTHCADLCIWDLEQKKLISHWVSHFGEIRFIVEVKKNWLLLGTNDYHNDCRCALELIDITKPEAPKQLAHASLPENCWITDMRQGKKHELSLLLYAKQYSLFATINWIDHLISKKEKTIPRTSFTETSYLSHQLFHLDDKNMVIVCAHNNEFCIYNRDNNQLIKKLAFSASPYDVFSPSIQLKNGTIVNVRTLERSDTIERSCIELYYWNLHNSQSSVQSINLPLGNSYVSGLFTLYETAKRSILLTPDDQSDRIIEVDPRGNYKEFHLHSSLNHYVFTHDGQKFIYAAGKKGLHFHSFPFLENIAAEQHTITPPNNFLI